MELVGALIAPLLAGVAAASPAVELELLYRNDQLLPGALVPIAGIQERAPEPCGDAVGFRASSPGHGIWAYRITPSGVKVVVDGTVQIPGSSETFGGVVDLRCRGAGRFSFVGRGAVPGGSVYGWSPDGSIELFQSEDVVVEGVAFDALVEQRANHQGVSILGYLAPFYSGEGLMYRPLAGAARFVTDDNLILPSQTEPPSSLSQHRARHLPRRPRRERRAVRGSRPADGRGQDAALRRRG